MDESPVRPGPAMEEAPLYRAEIELPREPESVRAWSPTTEVKLDGCTIRLLVSQIHEALIVRMKT